MKKSIFLLAIMMLMLMLTGCASGRDGNDSSVVKDVTTVDHVVANNIGYSYMGMGGYATEDDKYVYLSTYLTNFGGGIVKVDKATGKTGYIPLASNKKAKKSGDTTPTRLIRYDDRLMYTTSKGEQGEMPDTLTINAITTDGKPTQTDIIEYPFISADRLLFSYNDIFLVADGSDKSEAIGRYDKDRQEFETVTDFQVTDENGETVVAEYICGKGDRIYFGYSDTENKKYKIFSEPISGGTPELLTEFPDEVLAAKNIVTSNEYIYIRNENAREDFHQFLAINMTDGTTKTLEESIITLWDFFACDDCFYVRDSDTKALYRYSADGSDKTKVLDGIEGTLRYVDSEYYYFISEDSFYRIKKDSTDATTKQELISVSDI